MPAAQCSVCREGCCEKHLKMIGAEWVCIKCVKDAGARKPPT